ncbi:11846_t:CDS:1, partial [Funneliformis mosseae]
PIKSFIKSFKTLAMYTLIRLEFACRIWKKILLNLLRDTPYIVFVYHIPTGGRLAVP